LLVVLADDMTKQFGERVSRV